MKSAYWQRFGRGIWLKAIALGMGSLLVAGCGGGAPSDGVRITGELSNYSGDSIRIYEVLGVRTTPIGAAKVESDGKAATFTLDAKIARTGFFLIGDDPRRSVNAVLAPGEALTFKGDFMNPKSYALEGGATNDAFHAMEQRVIDHNQKLQGLYQNMQLFAASDPMQVNRIQNDIADLNKRHFAYLDSVEAQGTFVSKIAKMYNFKPFMSDPGHSKYGNELDYFKGEFFSNLDLADQEVGGMPQVYDKARAYALTITGANMPADVAKAALDGVLAKTKSGDVAHESLLRGYIAGLEQSKSDLFIDYGQQFIAAYPGDQQFVAAINQVIAQRAAQATGAEAPDFSAPTPEGGTMKLSDLRGKVVLIDFWASWCRPCRMENPNVLKAYNKYRGKGFEILGVSLDDTKAKWEAAIQQDGLVWKHVSDLQGWRSAPAQLYGVSSIPATVLLDKEGKIIARNLRGPALEEKLAEIFGS